MDGDVEDVDGARDLERLDQRHVLRVGDVDDQEVARIVDHVVAAGGDAGRVGDLVVDQRAAELVHVAAVGLALVVEQRASQGRHGGVGQVDRDEVAEPLEDGAPEVEEPVGRDERGGAGAVDQQVGQEAVVDRRVADERRGGRVGQRVDQQVEDAAVVAVGGADDQLAVDDPGDVEAELAVGDVVLAERPRGTADWSDRSRRWRRSRRCRSRRRRSCRRTGRARPTCRARAWRRPPGASRASG